MLSTQGLLFLTPYKPLLNIPPDSFRQHRHSPSADHARSTSLFPDHFQTLLQASQVITLTTKDGSKEVKKKYEGCLVIAQLTYFMARIKIEVFN